jgi:LysR family transcriptional regulator of abg operon
LSDGPSKPTDLHAASGSHAVDRLGRLKQDGLQLRHINALVAVADTGSLHAASQRLGMSQPSLTKTIRELEAIFGLPLVHRTVRGSVPTNHGQIFLVRARSIVEEVRRAKEELNQAAGISGGSVTIGISVGASLLFAAEAIGKFMRDHPLVRVRVIHGLFEQLVNGVRQGRFDFSVGGMPSTEAGTHVHMEPLFRTDIVPAVRLGHPLAKARHFSQLIDNGWAITNDEPSYVTHLSDHFAKLELGPPKVMLRCESFFTILHLIPQTDLIVAMPQSLLAHKIVAERLIPIKIEDPCPTALYAMVRKADVPLSPLAESLARDIRHATARLAV